MPTDHPALAQDWLGACRAAAAGLREVLAEHPTSAQRIVETGVTGEGGDRTLVIDQLAEDRVFAQLELLHEQARFTAVSEERGRVDFGDDGVLVVIDPIDGSLNAKRGLTHHALSVAVADGPTMADVAFAYVLDLGPGEEWTARRGEGALRNGVPLGGVPERRTEAGKLEIVAIESADPRWLVHRVDDLACIAHRLRAMGSMAISVCQVAGARVDGMVSLWRTRAVDVAAAQLVVRESGGHVAFVGAPQPLDAPLDLEPHFPIVAARTTTALAELADIFRVIDWGLTRSVALAAAGADRGPSSPPIDLDALAADAVPRIAARTGLRARDLPPLEWVGRDAWVDANLRSFEAVLGPALAQAPPAPAPVRMAAGALLAAEMGGLLGLMGRRVLGQYDVRLTAGPSPRRLLLVAPNLDAAARGLDVDAGSLVAWVGVHELTHAVQFSGAPWLREWLAERVAALLGGLGARPDLGAVLRTDPRELARRLWAEGPLALVGGERRAALDELQAAMTLVEGHAEWVMDAVGDEVLDDVDVLREALGRRRDARPPLLRLLDRFLGLELKLRQYRQGRAFCDAVVAGGGDDALARAWSDPAALPSGPELADPAGWLSRTA